MSAKGKYKLRVNVARGNLLLFTILTAVNFLIVLFGRTFSLPYSSFISIYSLALAYSDGGDAVLIGFNMRIAAYAVTVFILVFLVLCYFLSKKYKSWLFAATAFSAVDFAAVLFVIISEGYSTLYLLHLLMHVIMMFYMIRGVTAYSKLSGDESPVITTDDVTVDETPTAIETPNEKSDNSENGLPLYDNSGKQIYSARFNDYNIIVARSTDDLILVINGFIYGTEPFDDHGIAEINFELNGEKLKAVFDPVEKKSAVLYLNGKTI